MCDVLGGLAGGVLRLAQPPESHRKAVNVPCWPRSGRVHAAHRAAIRRAQGSRDLVRRGHTASRSRVERLMCSSLI